MRRDGRMLYARDRRHQRHYSEKCSDRAQPVFLRHSDFYPFEPSDDYMTAARTRAILSASDLSPFTI